jgi:Family of unknown function (DUF6298)
VSAGVLAALLASFSALACGVSGGSVDDDAGTVSKPTLGRTLRVLASNPRYFTDGSGRAIYLTGSHTWGSVIESHSREAIGCRDRPLEPFDYDRYLDLLDRYGHNFIRLWTWELSSWSFQCNEATTVEPLPWLRTGPGLALDGRPKFDLSRFDPRFFERLRNRVAVAGRRGFYVSVMLFEGWGLQTVKGAWNGHPFNSANNINGVDGDQNGDGNGAEVHTLAVPDVTRIQDAYVRKVVETVNVFDNVLFEISNESGEPSSEWQYHVIDVIKQHERRKPKQHPVGMTFQHGGGDNATLVRSRADWISPASLDGLYIENPPPVTGRQVNILDSDHLCGICGGESDIAFVWKSFFRGYNPIYMDDPFDPDPVRERVRQAMGLARTLADRVGLETLEPAEDRSSTGYALVDPGLEYLVYQPDTGPFSIDLADASGRFTVSWLATETGRRVAGRTVPAGSAVRLDPPFDGPTVAHLKLGMQE